MSPLWVRQPCSRLLSQPGRSGTVDEVKQLAETLHNWNSIFWITHIKIEVKYWCALQGTSLAKIRGENSGNTSSSNGWHPLLLLIVTLLCCLKPPLLSQFSTVTLKRWGLMSNLLLLEISRDTLATDTHSVPARGRLRTAFKFEWNATWSSRWPFWEKQDKCLSSFPLQWGLINIFPSLVLNNPLFKNSLMLMEGLG